MHGQFDSSPSNTGRTSQKVPLSWDVFLAPSIPAITSDLPPGEKERPWPPISSTLISGERDAVLVDTPITVEQARALANWVVATGKNLTTIYAPHGHGDHFFGTNTVLDRFPGARFVARPDVIKVMRQQASPESLATFWNPRFPGQISSHLAIAEELAGNVINLEGHDLVSVPLGFTDTANTTCLHVPAIGMSSAKGNSKSLRPMVVSLLWLTGTSKRLMCHITRSSPTAESQCTSGTAGRLGNSP
jgi:hypothetical protein